MRDEINDKYFEWLFNLACGDRYSRNTSYRKLLTYLHSVEFTYIIPMDANRAEDGVDLRYRYTLEHDCEELLSYLSGPCSVLEMITALSIRCEETIMDNPALGDRTRQWFWSMISNLGLGHMMDQYFDQREADDIILRFLNREYEPDGRGGLFTIKHCKKDLRRVEIWYQLCWYLDDIV